jgi:predicted nicotinamide N-methyase
MGLPGLLCAALGAASVLLTDYEPVVVEALRRNAELNGVARVCSFLSLDWLDLSPLAPAQRGAQDLLLLADVIYAAAVVRPLVATLRALLRPQSGAALVAHRIRRPLVFDRVDKIARLQVRLHQMELKARDRMPHQHCPQPQQQSAACAV